MADDVRGKDRRQHRLLGQQVAGLGVFPEMEPAILEELREAQIPLVLFDPGDLSREGLAFLKALHDLDPALPLVVLGGGEYDGEWATEAGLNARVLHRMGRETSIQSWPATLRSCLGGFGPAVMGFA